MTNQQVLTFSPEGNDFLNWVETGNGSCVLVAVAGAGKTTILIEALKRMQGNIYFGAYNKKIAVEITERAPQRQGLKIGTMHAAGFQAWRRVAGNVQVNDNKCRDLYRNIINPEEDTALEQLESAALKLVSYAKQAALGIVTPSKKSTWLALIEHFNIDTLEQDERVIELAHRVIGLSVKEDSHQVDFDDMIFAPLYHKARMFQNDWVLIDEAQDTNASRRALALKMLKPGGRLIAVGDPHQAIYGFTGADSDALDLIATSVNAKRMPLTVTYRCPKAVVKYAQQWVNHIHAHESAPEGMVRTLEQDAKLIETVKGKDAILCRFNAPLIQMVYEFIGAGIAAKVEGRDIGNGLKALARRWKVKSFDALLQRLDSYQEREVAKFTKKQQESKAQSVIDQVSCLRVIIARTQKVNPTATDHMKALSDQIDSIFEDSVNGNHVVLTSIHKAKGREWNRVFWAQTGPASWAKQDWELQQENNLCYVAATRAKVELVLFSAPKK